MEVNSFLEPILKRQENKTCADCPNKNPRWASINFGTFVCIQCAGIHRNLGVHITKIKSVTLDKWNDDMMMIYNKMNNIIANQFWEARLVESQKPGAGVRSYVQEKFIRDKYIDKKFAKQNEQDPATRILKGEDIGLNIQESQQQSNVKQINQQQSQPQQVVNYAKPANLQSQQQNTIVVKPQQEQIDLLQLDQSDKVEFTEFQQAEEVKDTQNKTNVLGNDQLVNIDWGSPQALNANQNFNQQQQQPTQQANAFQQQQFYQAPQQQQQQNVTNAILNLYNQVPQSQLQQKQDKNKFIPQGMIAAQNYIQQPQVPPMYGGGYMYQQQQYMPVQNNVYMNMGYQQNSMGNTGAYYGNQGWGQK